MASALDKDLKQVQGIGNATQTLLRSLAAPGLAFVFLLAAGVWASFGFGQGPSTLVVAFAAAIAGYMALNIGANDVANNMGPAVGARAISMAGALIVAAIFEAAGALISGGNVASTVAQGLISMPEIDDTKLVMVMLSALIASALWINLATYIHAPVSTTHSIVGGVVGAGISAAGMSVVSWPMIGAIAASWVISPVMGGVIAALLLVIVRATIIERLDKLAAARIWVPVFVAVMTGTFAMYLAIKGLGRLWSPDLLQTLVVGFIFAALGWLVAMPRVRKRSLQMENRSKHVATLFRIPLVVAAALLSFAHGANDVANAVGPLAAIVTSLESGRSAVVNLPFWELAIGALGISLGLALFGPRLIRTVGEHITRLNEIRACCAALSTAMTVLVASALGLPVSTTHIAVGAIFGIGFVREYISRRDMVDKAVPVNSRFVDPERLNATPEEALANARKAERRRLVRRQHAYSIAAAWLVTLPAASALAALFYLAMNWIIV